MAATARARRSCLSVPASNPRMIDKSRGLGVDMVFLDLEDAVAPDAKEQARANAVAALRAGGWRAGTVGVRVNDATSPWAVRDVVAVVEGAGAALDCIVLPKVEAPAHVQWLDLTLGQLEAAAGLERAIGIEVQVETARGLTAVEEIARASARVQTLVFGPADFMASTAMPSLTVGGLSPDYPGDPFHHVLARILVAARAAGVQAIDGPWLAIRDLDGLRAAARRSRALGYDGKWVLHPDQVDVVNEVFSPEPAAYAHAERIVAAYAHATSTAGGRRGAVMLGEEMIDEASRKLAEVLVAQGRAAGLTPPADEGRPA